MHFASRVVSFVGSDPTVVVGGVKVILEADDFDQWRRRGRYCIQNCLDERVTRCARAILPLRDDAAAAAAQFPRQVFNIAFLRLSGDCEVLLD